MITDSSFLYNKHKEYRANLLQVPPGVDFDRFNKTWRGDEMQKLSDTEFSAFGIKRVNKNQTQRKL